MTLSPTRVMIDRVGVDPLPMAQVLQRIRRAAIDERQSAYHVITVNAQFIELARRVEGFSDLIARCDLSVADGVPLLWASRLLGTKIPERINGTDLMTLLCREAASDGRTVYLLGGRPDAGRVAADKLCESYPGLKVVGIDCPPYGFIHRPEQLLGVAERIRLARPDLLFVGLGAPTQEYWIQQHLALPAKVMMGIGGSFELLAGFQKRAPRLFQRMGCEWLWRLTREPGRLWKRYAVGNSLFVYLVLRQWIRGIASRWLKWPPRVQPSGRNSDRGGGAGEP